MSTIGAPTIQPVTPYMYLDWQARGRPGFIRTADPVPAVESLVKLHDGDVTRAREALESPGPSPEVRHAVMTGLGVEAEGFAANPDCAVAGLTIDVDDYWPGWSDDLVRDFANFCGEFKVWDTMFPAPEAAPESAPEPAKKTKSRKGAA